MNNDIVELNDKDAENVKGGASIGNPRRATIGNEYMCPKCHRTFKDAPDNKCPKCHVKLGVGVEF